jgi:peptidoglycan/LPS O-acetylase OafA/YrhL
MNTPVKKKYRPEIDGLRAFAVIAVIINHFNKDLLPSGYLGVDVFFVISGYVITSSLAGRKSRNFLDFLMGFYVRRIKRLVPALIVFVLITSVLISLFSPSPGIALGLGWRSLIGISNISLYRASTDYFAPAIDLNPFVHTWSLSVEEQFYVLFPFLIWFSGFGQQKAKGARNLFFCVGVLTLASLISFIHLYRVDQPAAYFLMPPRFWEMAAGCLIFIGFQKRVKIEQALEKFPPLVAVAAMVGLMALPVSAAVPATIGMVLLTSILIACLKEGTTAFKFFTNDKVVFIGLISFPLYLWHWTILSMSKWTIGIHWWSIPIQVVIIFLMALGSFYIIEHPIRNSNLGNRNLVLLLGLASIVLSGIFTRILGQFHDKFYLGSVKDKSESRISTYLERSPKQIDSLLQNCLSGHPPFKDALLGSRVLTRDFKNNCLWLGADTSKPIVAFVGDSLNASFYSSARRLHQEGFSVIFHSRPACLYLYPESTVPGCKEVMESTTNFLISKFEEKGGGVIVIANYYQGHFSADGNMIRQFKDRDTDIIIGKFSKSVEQLSKRLSNVNAGIVLIKPLPDHPYYARPFDPIYPNCNPEWFSRLNASCPGDKHGTSKSFIQKEIAPISTGIERVATIQPNIVSLDFFDLLCSANEKCMISKNNKPMYSSSNYLSTHGNKVIYLNLRESIISASELFKLSHSD